MKRSFLVSLSWSNLKTNGVMNLTVNFEDRGFRPSDIEKTEKIAESEVFKIYGSPEAKAVVLHVSELEAEE